MFWMFLINAIGILMMWVAFWFLLIITQKGGKTSDKSQSFQLWFFLFVLQAGRSGQTNDCSLWVPGPASWQLWVKLADFCDCSLSPAAQPGLLLHGLPGVPSFGTIVRYLAQTHQFCQGISSSLHARLPQLKNYCSVSDRDRCRTSDFGVGFGAARCCSACCTSPPSLRTLAEIQQI